MTPRFELRVATPDDIEQMADTMAEGFDGYRSFAPDGWEPPSRDQERGYIRDNVGHPDVWAMVAHAGGEPAGHVAFMASSRSWAPGAQPDLAHFWHLWIRRPYWGTGLARDLHNRALEEACRRRFGSMRLFTPEGQTRARAFYEREGWISHGEPFDPGLGIPLVEYRLHLR